MRALGDFVVVMQQEKSKENKTSAGIILTSDVENTGHKPAIVIAVGPNVTSVEPGQKVFLNWQESQPFTDDGQRLAAVKETSIFAVF